jgi:hypothetical protein
MPKHVPHWDQKDLDPAAIDGDLERIYHHLSNRQSNSSKVKFAMSEIHWHIGHPVGVEHHNAQRLRAAVDDLLSLLLREAGMAKSHRVRSQRELLSRVETGNNDRIDRLGHYLLEVLAVWRDSIVEYRGHNRIKTYYHFDCPECSVYSAGLEALRLHRIRDHGQYVPNIRPARR